jgi:hypothetical protein
MNPCGLSHLIAPAPADNLLVMKIERSMNALKEDLAREERPVVTMALVLGLLYVASFAVAFAAPELPAEIHEALACLPSLITS